MTRKEFFQNSGRWVILGGIGLFTGFLASNNRIVRESDCRVSSVCNSCNRFSGCKLPQANK